ncbi:Hypothetical predicted protein [Paramuricea clavata]|uniref:Uncharacterized protein n=1 Tax=Paramuricea clavata TaxID=317549 RepID=A0A6S7GGT6_PARCT|nr:Hypothetical predicted protein [Paramuricea clavata]
MSGTAQPIEVIVDTNLKKEVEENRSKLAPIIDTVLFCSRLGLPLRGHRDDAKYHPEVGSYSTGGVGNFVESLNFRVRAGDKILEDHLKTCGKNRSYISKTSQNKIINCCGQVISEKIINDIKEINTMLKHVNEVSHFINISQTRNMPFEDIIKTHSSDTESRKTKLGDVCRTRWVERIEGLDTFTELFVPLHYTLEAMKTNSAGEYNPSLSSDASSHLTRILKFEFVAALVITRHILDVTLDVTKLLQGKTIDIMDGIHLINSLKDNIILMRNSVDRYHNIWYEEALQLAIKVGLEESKPRTVGRQTARANHPFKTISEYYKRTITIPFIDHLHSSLQARFDIDSVNVYKGLSIVPSKMLSLTRDGIDWIEEFKTLATFYYDDLPNPLALDAELSLWDTYWTTFEGPCPSNIATTLKAVRFEGFTNIKVILRILDPSILLSITM